MIYAIIAAGGIGSRMGKGLPKQYIKVKGKPIIVHTVEKFLSCERIDKIIVLCPNEWVDYTKKLFNNDIVVISAGSNRNETLMNAVSYIENTSGLDESTYIITHDAVRPFVSIDIINENIDLLLKYGATGTYINATDTIAQSLNGETLSAIPDRSTLYQAQTPQCFKAKKFKKLYSSLTNVEKETLTDACKIFILKGCDVRIVKGDVSNIKITYPFDLIVANAILESE